MEYNILNKAETLKDIMKNILDYKKMSKEDILNFINFNIKEHNPYLLTNMDKAIERIIKAIQNKEIITIIGDYDVDGVCSTTVLYLALKEFIAVNFLIPNRFTDGYGINQHLIDVANDKNTNLIITVDNGIKAHEQVKYANSLGIDVIVTDHHSFEDDTLPTEITVNPQIDNSYPFKNICGCFVAYKLAIALLDKLKEFEEYKIQTSFYDILLVEEITELTCIATIADVMPLLDENRLIVKKGLDLLNRGAKNIGLRELIRALNIHKITSTDVGFYIAPCINAAGRLESADLVMDLFLEEDIAKCKQKANYLINLNTKRKEIQSNIINDLVVDDNDDFIVIHIKENLTGIVGIIAGEISGRYNKPCFCLCGEEHLHGSGRSVYNYPINQIVEKNDFIEGGGHKSACGLKVEASNLDKLKKICNEDYRDFLKNNEIEQNSIDIINQIDFNLISNKMLNNLNQLQPFGEKNEEPLFYTEDVEIISKRIVGKNKNVVQMELSQKGNKFKAIGFSQLVNIFDELNGKINIIYSVQYNEFPKGTFTIQLLIKDIK
jgi:single-stranded-DNA-specific exonuclease